MNLDKKPTRAPRHELASHAVRLLDRARRSGHAATINCVAAIASGFAWIDVSAIAAGGCIPDIGEIIVKCHVVYVDAVSQ